MITCKEDYKFYIEADRLARDFKKKFYFGNRGEIPLYKYQRLMRKVEK